MGKEQRPTPEIGVIGDDRAAGTKEDIFVYKVDSLAPWGAHDEALHLISKVVGVNKHAVNTSEKQQIEPIREQRAPMDWDQAFWNRIGKGPQAAADPCCQ